MNEETGLVALCGFCFLKTLSRMERVIVEVVLEVGEEGHCGGGGGEANGLELMLMAVIVGVVGDRTAPLTFKVIVELIQAVGQTKVIGRIGGFRIAVCDLPEPPNPFETESLAENCCCSFSDYSC